MYCVVLFLMNELEGPPTAESCRCHSSPKVCFPLHTVKCDMSDKGGTEIKEEYNEANFPGKAESEDEDCNLTATGENAPQVRQDLTGMVGTQDVQHSISDDMSCVVCSEVLVDPCSLQCGHSFCQLCLANLWKSKARAPSTILQCPICRESWGSSYPGINIQLRYEPHYKFGLVRCSW